MSTRRSRPTIRCLVDDLGIVLPDLGIDIGTLPHPFLDELRRIAPTSPQGQKRVLSIDRPLIYRIRVSSDRGATWTEELKEIVWLCAAHRREAGSSSDAYQFFAELHAANALLPNQDDRLRDRAEAATRLQRGLAAELLSHFEEALTSVGIELQTDLGEWLPCRIIVLRRDGLEEIWCGLSIRDTKGDFVPEPVRDLLFGALERHVRPALTETRNDWPTGEPDWFEVVVLSVR